MYARAGGESEGIREDEAKQWPRISSCRRLAGICLCGTHRQITGSSHTNTDNRHTRRFLTCVRVTRSYVSPRSYRTRNTTKDGHERERAANGRMCVASLCSKPAKNPTSMGSLSAGIRESNALKSPRSNRENLQTLRFFDNILL